MSSVRHFLVSSVRHFSTVVMSHTLKMHRSWSLYVYCLCYSSTYVASTPEIRQFVFGTPCLSSVRHFLVSSVRHFVFSSVRHSFGSSERRGAGAAEDVARGPAELDVDDAVQDEVDGEVDQEQAVGDDRRRLVGKEHLARTPSSRLQHVLTKEVQQSRSSRTFSPGRTSFQSTRRVPPAVRGLLLNRSFSPYPF